MVKKLDLFVQKKKKMKPVRKNQDVHDFKISREISTSTLFSRGRVQKEFFTNDSGRYISPRDYSLLREGKKYTQKKKTWDGVSRRIVSDYRTIRPSSSDLLFKKYQRAKKRQEKIKDNFKEQTMDFLGRISFVRLWNGSIVASIVLGMFFMSMIYRYMGQSTMAFESADKAQANYERMVADYGTKKELKREEEEKANEEWNHEKEDAYIGEVMRLMRDKQDENFEKEVRLMVKGYPIEQMLPYILKKDQTVAAFLIAIAKKESNWGKRVPVRNGEDCYNYWGYRGIRDKMGTGGHTCFDSPEDAVNTVAKRLEWFINEKKLDTPSELIVWKCGSTCKGHDAYGVKKWISDVDMYFARLNDE